MATFRARPIKYDAATGLEIWGYSAPGLECTDFIGTVMARHIDTDWDTGIEIWARCKECCDVTTPANEQVFTCFLPGLTKHLIANIYEVENCISAQCLQAPLEWQAGSGTWTGSFDLRSGTIDMELECVPTGDPDFPDFELTLSGTCGGGPYGPIVIPLLFACDNPWARNTGNIDVDICCGCTAADTSDIEIYVIGNCQPFKLCRWIDVDRDTGLEIWGFGELCTPWNVDCDSNACDHIKCELVLEITDISGCPGLAGAYPLLWNPPGTDHWEASIPGPGAPQVVVYCDENGDLIVQLTCGANGGGIATGHTDDAENIDVTMTMSIGDPDFPPSCCEGDIEIRITR